MLKWTRWFSRVTVCLGGAERACSDVELGKKIMSQTFDLRL